MLQKRLCFILHMLRKSKQFFNIWVINHIIRTQTNSKG